MLELYLILTCFLELGLAVLIFASINWEWFHPELMLLVTHAAVITSLMAVYASRRSQGTTLPAVRNAAILAVIIAALVELVSLYFYLGVPPWVLIIVGHVEIIVGLVVLSVSTRRAALPPIRWLMVTACALLVLLDLTFINEAFEMKTEEESVEASIIQIAFDSKDPESAIAARKKAESLLKQLESEGANFAELARQHSDHEKSKLIGGYLGFIKVTEAPPGIVTTVRNLEPGQIGDLVKVKGFREVEQDGYYIIKRPDGGHELKPELDNDH